MNVPNPIHCPRTRIGGWRRIVGQPQVPVIVIYRRHIARGFKAFEIVRIEAALFPVNDASDCKFNPLRIALNDDILWPEISMGKYDFGVFTCRGVSKYRGIGRATVMRVREEEVLKLRAVRDRWGTFSGVTSGIFASLAGYAA